MSRVRPSKRRRDKAFEITEKQIIGVLREQETGSATAEVCRKHGISPATFCQWNAKFGRLEVSEARRLRTLEVENAGLKKLLAGATPCILGAVQVRQCSRPTLLSRDNLLVTGPTGTGKTWLSCALGHRACRDNRSVLYQRVPRLLEALGVARGDGRYGRHAEELGAGAAADPGRFATGCR